MGGSRPKLHVCQSFIGATLPLGQSSFRFEVLFSEKAGKCEQLLHESPFPRQVNSTY